MVEAEQPNSECHIVGNGNSESIEGASCMRRSDDRRPATRPPHAKVHAAAPAASDARGKQESDGDMHKAYSMMTTLTLTKRT